MNQEQLSEERKKEARWLSDLETLKKHHNKFKRDKDGFLLKDTKENAEKYMRVTLANSDKYVEMENEKLRGDDKAKDDKIRILLGKTYEMIIEVLKKYIKLKEEYYDLVAVWIIGTYCMKKFETYPYLFINAQKGSGKTRLLKLIEQLANKGELLASMREAVLFRIATDDKTILIDELEGLDRKENAPLKELLNACYKRGTKVYRMKKKGDDYVAQPFFPFTPIAIANISGTDDVLGDRCIAIRLDKSSKSTFSLLQEDFSTSPLIKSIKFNFEQIKESLCSWCSSSGGYTLCSWNNYIILRFPTTTHTTYTTYTTPNTLKNENSKNVVSVVKKEDNEFDVVSGVVKNDFSVDSGVISGDYKRTSVYNKIINSGINGRHLELVFPLLVVSLMINDELFEKILATSKEVSEKKTEDDFTESNDVSLIEFVSKMSVDLGQTQFKFVYELSEQFRFFLGIRDKMEQQEINPKWLGRALKRIGLVREKRRLSAGVEVTLDIIKAKRLLEDMR